MTPSRGAGAACRVGGAHRLQPRPGPLPRGGDAGGRRTVRGRGVAAEGSRRAADGRRRHRPLGLVRRAGPTRSPRWRARSNPVAGPYFNFTVPEPTGVVGIVAPEAPPARAGVAACACPRRRQRRGRRGERGVGRCPAVTLAEVLATSDVPAGVVDVLTGAAPSCSRPRRTYGRERHRPVRRGGGGPGRAGTARGGKPQAGVHPRGGADGAWAGPPDPGPMMAFLETKTVWHPNGI